MPQADSAQSERLFRFTTTTEKPSHRVACLACHWTATGSNAKVWEKADAHTVCLPERGKLVRHPMYRGHWRVQTVGTKWVTLKTTFPVHGYGSTVKVHVEDWPEKWRDA